MTAGNPEQRRPGVEGGFKQPQLLPPNLKEAYDRLLLELETHPYQTIAATAGLGFLLGGGLFSGLARNVIGAGLRVGIANSFGPLLMELLDRTEHTKRS